MIQTEGRMHDTMQEAAGLTGPDMRISETWQQCASHDT
jgi:hypothetical protein